MTISSTPTNMVMVKVYSNSEWDNADFILLDLSDDAWNESVLKKIESAQQFKDDLSFHNISFWSQPEGYFVYADQENVPILGDDDWFVFVQTSQEEIETLLTPEQSLDCHVMKISSDGTIKFSASGKHTSEEFWTVDIDFKQILNKLNDSKSNKTQK